jgi:hypothetical protein
MSTHGVFFKINFNFEMNKELTKNNNERDVTMDQSGGDERAEYHCPASANPPPTTMYCGENTFTKPDKPCPKYCTCWSSACTAAASQARYL